MRIDTELRYDRLYRCGAGTSGGFACRGQGSAFFDIGGGYGITDRLEVGAIVAPLRLTAGDTYGSPSVYGKFQFLRGSTFQAGATLRLTLQNESELGLAVDVGVPFWINFTERFQLQTGINYRIATAGGFSHALDVPLRFNNNVSDHFHTAFLFGLGFNASAVVDTLAVPFGIEAGYVLAGTNNHPVLDVTAQFLFPRFLVPAASGDPIQTERFIAVLNARLYLFL